MLLLLNEGVLTNQYVPELLSTQIITVSESVISLIFAVAFSAAACLGRKGFPSGFNFEALGANFSLHDSSSKYVLVAPSICSLFSTELLGLHHLFLEIVLGQRP